MFCCGTKAKVKRNQTREDIEGALERKLRMNDDQIYEFAKRFNSLAVSGKLYKQKYKDSLGLMGVQSLSFLAERMFIVMSKGKDHIILNEYLGYIDVMMYGSEEERQRQSFQLLDKAGNGRINSEEFIEMVQSFAQMWSAALKQPLPLNLRYFRDIFNRIAIGKPFFNFEEETICLLYLLKVFEHCDQLIMNGCVCFYSFIRYMNQNPDALAWFSNPQKAMKHRINEYANRKQMEQQAIIDKVENLNQLVGENFTKIRDQICFCLDVIDPQNKGNAMRRLTDEYYRAAPADQNQNMTNLSMPNNQNANGEAGQTPWIGNNQRGLLEIGETPNPDDEDTQRHLVTPFKSTLKLVKKDDRENPFSINAEVKEREIDFKSPRSMRHMQQKQHQQRAEMYLPNQPGRVSEAPSLGLAMTNRTTQNKLAEQQRRVRSGHQSPESSSSQSDYNEDYEWKADNEYLKKYSQTLKNRQIKKPVMLFAGQSTENFEFPIAPPIKVNILREDDEINRSIEHQVGNAKIFANIGEDIKQREGRSSGFRSVRGYESHRRMEERSDNHLVFTENGIPILKKDQNQNQNQQAKNAMARNTGKTHISDKRIQKRIQDSTPTNLEVGEIERSNHPFHLNKVRINNLFKKQGVENGTQNKQRAISSENESIYISSKGSQRNMRQQQQQYKQVPQDQSPIDDVEDDLARATEQNEVAQFYEGGSRDQQEAQHNSDSSSSADSRENLRQVKFKEREESDDDEEGIDQDRVGGLRDGSQEQSSKTASVQGGGINHIEEEEKDIQININQIDQFRPSKRKNTLENKESHRSKQQKKSMHKQDIALPGKFYYLTENDEESFSRREDVIEAQGHDRSFQVRKSQQHQIDLLGLHLDVSPLTLSDEAGSSHDVSKKRTSTSKHKLQQRGIQSINDHFEILKDLEMQKKLKIEQAKKNKAFGGEGVFNEFDNQHIKDPSAKISQNDKVINKLNGNLIQIEDMGENEEEDAESSQPPVSFIDNDNRSSMREMNQIQQIRVQPQNVQRQPINSFNYGNQRGTDLRDLLSPIAYKTPGSVKVIKNTPSQNVSQFQPQQQPGGFFSNIGAIFRPFQRIESPKNQSQTPGISAQVQDAGTQTKTIDEGFSWLQESPDLDAVRLGDNVNYSQQVQLKDGDSEPSIEKSKRDLNFSKLTYERLFQEKYNTMIQENRELQTQLKVANDKVERLRLELAAQKERLAIGTQILENIFFDSLRCTKEVNLTFKELINKYRKIRKRSTRANRLQNTTQNVNAKIPKLLKKKENRIFNIRDSVRGHPSGLRQSEKSLNSSRHVSQGNDMEIVEENGLQGRDDSKNEEMIIQANARVISSQGIQNSGVKETNNVLEQRSPETPQQISQINYVHPAHHNFNMVFNIMLGIKMSVDANLDLPNIQISQPDYKSRASFGIAPYTTASDDNVKKCMFYDYAPKIFAQLRKLSGISKEKYLNSLGPENILSYIFNGNFQTLTELISSGKSGSFFYYSQDSMFLLKCIPRHEFKTMKKMLENYHVYLTEKNPQSFVSRVYGLHKIIFYRKAGKTDKKLYFCIMNNVFQTSKKIDLRYDLKGSLFGRQTISDQKGIQVDRTVALKDMDFLKREETIKVGSEYKRRIIETLKMDSDFFAENNIIDYSMLIGIHNRSEHPETFNFRNNNAEDSNTSVSQSYITESNHSLVDNELVHASQQSFADQQLFYQGLDGGLLSADENHVYFFGVIDIFTEFSFKKKVEYIARGITQDFSTISCVPPQRYAERFHKFLSNAFS